MGRTALTAACLTLLTLGALAPAKAQVNFTITDGNRSGTISIGGPRFVRPTSHVVHHPVNNWQPVRPSRPVYVTPDRVVNYNPWTGAVDTHNHQVNDTAFDVGRDMSRNNGSRRWVNRPIRDAWGNITGYERGWVWNNSITGQEHGETTVVRPNASGGSSSTTVLRSARPSDLP
ncbi:MAG: hypothetical protein AAF266_14825 [Planctomycetota bacterium]